MGVVINHTLISADTQWLTELKIHGKLIFVLVIMNRSRVYRSSDYDYLIDLGHQIQTKIKENDQRGGASQVN